MKIAVIGMGAIGSIVAADLASHDVPVSVVCKHVEIKQAIDSRGIRIHGLAELQQKDNLSPIVSIDELPANLDMILICTRSFALDEVLTALHDKISTTTTIIPMQNGITDSILDAHIAKSQQIQAVVSIAAHQDGPAEATITSSGKLILGVSEPALLEKAAFLQQHLKAAGEVVISDNIVGYKYSKLLMNASISSLSIVSGMKVGDILASRAAKLVLMTLTTEGVRVAEQQSIQLEKVKGLSPRSFAIKSTSFWHTWPKYLLLSVVRQKYKNHKSASLQMLEKGRKTEIDVLNGYIAKKGQELQVEVPINESITSLIHQIEDQRLQSGLSLLEQLEVQTKAYWERKNHS